MKKRILISSGGTAGHVYPTLEVARLLQRRRSLDILFVGSADSIEEKIIAKEFDFVSIPVGKLRRYPSLLTVRDGARVIRGIYKAHSIVTSFKPDLVFVKGGYVSLPITFVARRTTIPLVAHESDVVIGLANRFAIKAAQKVCVGFPTRYYPKTYRKKLVYTGVPIRKGFSERVKPADRQLFSLHKNMPVLCITGATQGSQMLNDTCRAILPSLLGRMQVIHITGKAHEKDFLEIRKKLPRAVAPFYHVYGFLEQGMESAVRCSDCVVSRAGSSIAEFAAAGLPMILVPLPFTGGDHQLKNAEVFTKEGAAITIRQQQLTPQRLLDTINTLLDDPHRLAGLSLRAKALAKPDATDNVVRVIEDVLYS